MFVGRCKFELSGYVLLSFFVVGLPFSPIVRSVFVGGEKVVCCVQSGSVVL